MQIQNFLVVEAFHFQKTPRFSPLFPGENAHAPLSLRSPNRKILQGAGASRDVLKGMKRVKVL